MLSRPMLRRLALSAIVALAFAFPRGALAHGDLHVRIDALTIEIGKSPENAELFLQRGELHRLHEDWAKADADLNHAEKLNPKLVAVWLARGNLLLAQKQFKPAELAVERFLAAHPKHYPALIVRAQALAGQERFLDAADTWQQVIDAAPAPDVEYYYQRAQALAAAGPEHTDAALRALDAGLEKLGNLPTLALRAIELEVSRQRYDAALERLDHGMPKTGRKETWRELRGDILLKAGKPAEARKEYTQALEEVAALPPRIRSTKAGEALEARLRSKSKP